MEENESKEILSKIQSMERELFFLKERVLSLSQSKTISKPIPSELPKQIHPLDNKETVPLEEGPNWFIQWIGQNLFVKLGVFSLILASVWFFYLAIEEYWINESVRIWIGILSSLPVLWYGYKTKDTRPYLSPSLLGLGIAVLFSAYYSGYVWYDLYGTETCFVGLILLSLTAVGISYAEKSEVLFGFASLGVFLSPILVSTGQNSYPFLFTYLLIWNALFFWIRKEMEWKVIPLIVLFANHLIFAIWAESKLQDAKLFYPLAFQIGVYLLFLIREFQVLKANREKEPVLTLVTLGFTLGLGFIQAFWIFGIFYPTLKPFLLTLFLLSFYIIYSRSLKEITLTEKAKSTYDIVGLFGLPLIISVIVMGMTGKTLAFSLISFAFVVTMASTYSKQMYMYLATFPVWFFALLYAFAFTYRSFNEIPFLNGRFVIFATGSLYLVLSYWYSRNFSPFAKLFLYVAYPYFLLGNFVEIHLGFPEEKRLFLYSICLIFYGLCTLVIGFKKEIQSLKVAGFVSLALVIAKFYLYDFWNLSLGYRILAGLFLGITLIVTGTFYNRIKKETV
ncbi:DUF2339 domain-containing protein [Leptospira jelokensis]|uniref:DUF2339 domain-containing protein n=1 Tax=Leptospira jelokensis TaxID=2484931 RepID=UPI001090FF8F|nr:DUF2339 domain-containing protein [Leptospira jelokensis]TGM00202.1 DUF2339 domain-containing protein [Leptospira jelokensis]